MMIVVLLLAASSEFCVQYAATVQARALPATSTSCVQREDRTVASVQGDADAIQHESSNFILKTLWSVY